MKLFISWSGQLSREVAETLRKYFPLMLQGIEVFMSKNDLQSGSRWSIDLAKELDESQFGIICLTPENLNNTWILFEAGALTKHFESRACGLLLGGIKPSEIAGPLSQFQHRVFEKKDFFSLLKDVNAKQRIPLAETQLVMIFEKWWNDLENDYQVALKNFGESSSEIPKPDQKAMLEEMLLEIREISKNISPKTRIDNYVTEYASARDISSIRERAQKMQRDLEAENIVIENGNIKVIIAGNQNVKSVEIGGVTNTELASALNEAIKKSQQLAAKKLQDMSSFF